MGLLAALTSSVSIPARAGAEAVRAASVPVPDILVGAELTSLMYQGGPVYQKRMPFVLTASVARVFAKSREERLADPNYLVVRYRYYDQHGKLIPDGAILQGKDLRHQDWVSISQEMDLQEARKRFGNAVKTQALPRV